MRFRLAAVALIALVFGLTQASGGALALLGQSSALAASIAGQRLASVAQADNAQADNDEADASDNGDAASSDNSGADNGTSDVAADNAADTSADNGETDTSGDNTSTGSGGSTASNSSGPAIDDDALKQPLTAVSGTSTGGDSMVATPGERVAVRFFPWVPAGIQVTIRPVDGKTVPASPGKQAGDLTFAVEAKDASGATLTALPAEVNLAIRYADSTVSGLNEGNLTLSRLDPSNNQWQPAPKIVREPDSNYVAASITQLGTYAVSAQ